MRFEINMPFVKKFSRTSNTVKNTLLIWSVAACLIMVYLEQTGVVFILEKLKFMFNFSPFPIEWVINSYIVTFAAFILFSGKLGDIYSHRTVFLSGISIFLLASIFCGLSITSFQLIASRLLQGFGAALITSNGIALIIENVDKESCGAAIGKTIAIASCIGIFGPLIASTLTHFISWRFVFLINIPFGLLSIIFIIISTSPIKPKIDKNIDWMGFFTFFACIVSLIVALMEGNNFGWNSIEIKGLLSLFLISLFLFILVEKNAKSPLILLSLFRHQTFTFGNLILFCIQICDISSAVFWTLYLQNALECSILLSGALILPLTIPGIYFSNLSGKLFDRFGPGLPLILGSIFVFIAFIWMIAIAHHKNYWLLLPSFLLTGIGESLIIPSTLTFLVSSSGSQNYGLASGIANTMRQIGGTIGLSVVGAIITKFNVFFKSGSAANTTFDVLDMGPTIYNASSTYASAFRYGMCIGTLSAALSIILAVYIFKNTPQMIFSVIPEK